MLYAFRLRTAQRTIQVANNGGFNRDRMSHFDASDDHWRYDRRRLEGH
jgi:hypothetical protein